MTTQSREVAALFAKGWPALLIWAMCLGFALMGCEDDGKPALEKSSPAPGKDDVEMVLIPAGEFLMGSEDEKTAHIVHLDAYYIDKFPVTNARYRKFMEATGHRLPLYWFDVRYNGPSHPVVGIGWEDAVAYAEWSGKRLPTEAEWEKAARGGLVGKKFPWGDELPDRSQANFHNSEGGTTPVTKYPPNGFGLYDMAGNVFNLCSDRYQWDYYKESPRENPEGPTVGDHRVARGGSWRSIQYYISCSSRYDVHWIVRAFVDVGFRFARDTRAEP